MGIELVCLLLFLYPLLLLLYPFLLLLFLLFSRLAPSRHQHQQLLILPLRLYGRCVCHRV
jgi:hypothetical protein